MLPFFFYISFGNESFENQINTYAITINQKLVHINQILVLKDILPSLLKNSSPLTNNYMVTLKELLKDTKFETLPKEHQDNIMNLLEKVNKIRTAYGKPMTVTSGYRSMSDHLRIYKAKGITDKSKIPMKSKHLSGLAVDFADPKGELQKWVKDNITLMEEIGIWFEDFSATKGWVHCQSVAPASGKRFFYP